MIASPASGSSAPLRALLYARVSTPAQKRRSRSALDEPSVDEQFDQMRTAAANHGWSVVAEFEDVLSGSVPVSERSGGGELYALLQAGSFDLLVVYDNDRIGRDQDGVVAKVFRADLRRAGVQVFSVHQPLEPKPREEYQPYEDDSALWLESVSDTASSVYIRQFRRRRAFGMTNRITRKRLMAGVPPTGYLAERHMLPNGKAVLGKRYPDPEFAPIVQRIFGECEAGLSCVRIAKLLNMEGLRTPTGTLWIEGTIRGILNNPTYYGAAVYGKGRSVGPPNPKHPGWRTRKLQPREQWLVVEDAQHPALVSKEQWERCQAALRARQTGPRSWGESALLSGLVRCGKCGGPMYKNSGWRGGYYGCHLYRSTGKQECERNSIRLEILEEEVLRYLGDIARSKEVLAALGLRDQEPRGADAPPEGGALKVRLEALDRRLDKAREAYEAGVDSLAEFRARKTELLSLRADLEQRCAVLQRHQQQHEQREQLTVTLETLMARFVDGFRDHPLQLQKVLLRLVVAHVEVANEAVKVVFRDDLQNSSEYARAIEMVNAYSEAA